MVSSLEAILRTPDLLKNFLSSMTTPPQKHGDSKFSVISL
uniref:Uncharacterized protein n=1 Tax=Lepeophtheirus salmonis TaxID=72036 RepID=A0A0K2UG01_LEPSM